MLIHKRTLPIHGRALWLIYNSSVIVLCETTMTFVNILIGRPPKGYMLFIIIIYFPFAALAPAILPFTIISAIAFPPNLLPAWMPPVTSPAA